MAKEQKPKVEPIRLTKCADAILETAKHDTPRPELQDDGYTLDELTEARMFLYRMGVNPYLKGGTQK